MTGYKKAYAIIFIISFYGNMIQAQTGKNYHKKEFYISWGYNTEWYTHSNIRVVQPDLNNSYTLQHVRSHDHRGWDEGDFFHKDLTIPQYNGRVGYFFNEKKNIAFEINFDHTKFIITDGQQMRLAGLINNKNIDTAIIFSESNGFYYYLNNGANFLLFNLVKRWSQYSSKTQNTKIDVLVKAGIGPVIPHVENSLFGNKNDRGFQFGGWNTGIETDIRATFIKHVYLELAGKVDYARYSNLKIYHGRAKQSFGTSEIINIGYTFR